jgi:hypothetical protein
VSFIKIHEAHTKLTATETMPIKSARKEEETVETKQTAYLDYVAKRRDVDEEITSRTQQQQQQGDFSTSAMNVITWWKGMEIVRGILNGLALAVRSLVQFSRYPQG